MQEKYKAYFSSLRLERWPRSLAILPGSIAALFLIKGNLNTNNLRTTFCIFVAFLLTLAISVANYIINEIADAPFDKYHPTKKDRPLVKGEINKSVLIILWFVILSISFFISFEYFSLYFSYALASLLLAGILYNLKPFRFKDIPFLDSTLESANNPIRFLIGWYVIESSFPSLYLLLSWWFFGNFLMVGKRVAEKKFLTEEESSGYRISLRKYSLKSLVAFMIVNAALFLITFILFLIEFKFYYLFITIPFIIFYLSVFIKKSLKDRDGAEEPERLLKNPLFAIYTLILVIIFILSYLLQVKE